MPKGPATFHIEFRVEVVRSALAAFVHDAASYAS